MNTKKTSQPEPATSLGPATPTPPEAGPAPAPPAPAVSSPLLVTATANGGNRGTKTDLQAVYQAVIAGLLAFYAPGDVFQMASGTYTRDELIAKFQGFVQAAQHTKDANAEWRTNVQTERAMEQEVKVLRTGVKGIAAARFGAGSAQLLKFGFPPAKPHKKTAEAKAVAVEKGLATRKSRMTMGHVQKKDVKGNVSVKLVVTPVEQASQPPQAEAAAAAPVGGEPSQPPAGAAGNAH